MPLTHQLLRDTKRMLRTAALVTLHDGLKAKDNNNTTRKRFHPSTHYIITIYISVSTPRFDRIRFLRLGILNDLYAGKVYLWLPKTSTYILYEPEIMQRKLCDTNALAHACFYICRRQTAGGVQSTNYK